MSEIEIELSPVDHITTDALGPKGKRVFYIQGTQGNQVVTVIAEKLQIQALAIGAKQFLEDIGERFPELSEVSSEYNQEFMKIMPPVDPLFRIADIGLGYNVEKDWVVLIIHELIPENFETLDDDLAQEVGVIRFSCTRDQLQALSEWGLEVVQSGRKICVQCGQLEEPDGHLCVKKNGGYKVN